MTALKTQFDAEMFRLYERAKREASYHAARFFQMVTAHGGVETVNRLLPDMSDGFAELWKRGRQREMTQTVNILGYSERGAINALMFEIAYHNDSTKLLGRLLRQAITKGQIGSTGNETTLDDERGPATASTGRRADTLGCVEFTVPGPLARQESART